MLSYYTNYTATMPVITIYINCDTQLAINLGIFNLGDNDELIFTIKNYNYVDSQYVFMFRAKKADMDKNGEVIFKIPPEVSKRIKPGAFYNFTALLNALDFHQETEYRKLTGDGAIRLEYGAQDLLIEQEAGARLDYEIVSLRLEPLGTDASTAASGDLSYEILSMRLEPIDEV